MMINGMASLPKVQDSANTSVRAFLNQVTKDYGHMFDPRMKTAKGKKVSNDDKKEWERVKKNSRENVHIVQKNWVIVLRRNILKD